VLTLFSELKSRIEKINTEKFALSEKTESLSAANENLQKSLRNYKCECVSMQKDLETLRTEKQVFERDFLAVESTSKG
jgi:uncharacterized protein (DUF3084 family)